MMKLRMRGGGVLSNKIGKLSPFSYKIYTHMINCFSILRLFVFTHIGTVDGAQMFDRSLRCKRVAGSTQAT